MQKDYSTLLNSDFDSTLILQGPEFFILQGNKLPTEEMLSEKLSNLIEFKTPMFNFIYPYDVDIFKESLTSCLKTGSSKIQCRIQSKDRKIRCVLMRMRLKEESLVLLNMVNITDEVTELYKILGESEAEFYSLAKHLPIGVFKLDPTGKVITFINEKYQEIFGVNIFEAKAGKWIEKIHPEDRENFITLREKSIHSEPFISTIRIKKEKDANSHHVRLIRKPLLDISGKITGFVGTIRVIDDEVRNERILQLNREKLLAAAKMSTLGEMTGSIAHEINNPLTIIYASAMILETSLKAPDLDAKALKEQVQIMYFTIERISKIINGLRIFSRSSSTDPMKKELLFQIIEDTLAFCQDKFKSRGIELRLDLNEIKGCFIRCRPAQISQVLLNLLNNSFDAVLKCEERWIKVIAVKKSEEIVVSVIDSGSGVPSAFISKLMTPFFTTKKANKENGLGLFVSRAFIEEHHGKLYYQEGAPHTTFIVELPPYETL